MFPLFKKINVLSAGDAPIYVRKGCSSAGKTGYVFGILHTVRVVTPALSFARKMPYESRSSDPVVERRSSCAW